MATGIYLLYWEQDDHQVYIGQSINIEYRVYQHISLLNSDNHYNYKLNKMYKVYGPPKYMVIELCSDSSLDDREVHWIEEFDSINNGFNITDGGIAGRGLTHSQSIYSKRKLLRVFSLLYNTLLPYKEVAIKSNISIYIVHNIASGVHHLWLKTEYPEQFQKMIDNKVLRGKLNVKSLKHLGIDVPLLKSPDGEIHKVTNIAEFCRNHPLLQNECDSIRSSIGKVLKGTKKSHKGWVLA